MKESKDHEHRAPAEPEALERRVVDLEQELERVRGALDASRAEQERLKARVSSMTEAERALRVSEEQFKTLAERLPVGVFQTDTAGDCTYVNERWQEITGLTREQALGPSWSSTLHPEDREHVYNEWYQAAQARREFAMEYRFQTPSGKVHWVSGRAVAVRDAAGEVCGYFGTLADITERKLAEAAIQESLLQKGIIRALEEAMAHISTPIIPITDRIVVMPLIGTIDGRRAERVLEALLAGVAGSQARVTILDVTGVPHLNAEGAGALVRAAQAVRLLGGQLVLSGIRPDVARTLVELEMLLAGIVTCGTLQAAITHAMRVAS